MGVKVKIGTGAPGSEAVPPEIIAIPLLIIVSLLLILGCWLFVKWYDAY